MDVTAIGAATIDWKMAQTQQAVQVSLLDKSMDSQSALMQEMVQDFQAANPVPSFGHRLDVLA